MDVNKVVEVLAICPCPNFLLYFALDYTVLPPTRGQLKVLPNKLWNNLSNPLLLIMNNYYKNEMKKAQRGCKSNCVYVGLAWMALKWNEWGKTLALSLCLLLVLHIREVTVSKTPTPGERERESVKLVNFKQAEKKYCLTTYVGNSSLN